MADTHLRFVIGSTFSGEGFKQAQQAVVNVNKNVKQANEVVGKLSGAIGQMDTSMIKGASAVTSMIQAFMTLNVTTIAVQAAVLAFNAYIQHAIEEINEFSKRANEAKAASEALFSNTLKEKVESVRKEIADVSNGFENLTRYANAVTAAMTGVRNAEGNGDIIALQTEKLQAMIAARTEEERLSLQQSYDLRIAQAKRDNVEAEGKLKAEVAQQAVIDSQNRVANINEQLAIVENERANLEAHLARQKLNGFEGAAKTEEKVNELKKIEASLIEKRIAAEDETEVLRIKNNEVLQRNANALASANNEILNLQLANKTAAEAAAASAVKTREATEATNEKKWAEEDARDAAKELADRQREAADLQTKLNASKDNLLKAQDEYRQALLKYGFNNDLNSYYSSKDFKGGTMPVDVTKAITLKAADAKVDDAIRNGAVTSVRDADRMRRQEARLGRDEANKNSGIRSQEAQRAQRLRQQNYDTLCAADKHFLEEYAKIEAAQQEQKDAVTKAKEAAEKQAEDVKEINERLKVLGLK